MIWYWFHFEWLLRLGLFFHLKILLIGATLEKSSSLTQCQKTGLKVKSNVTGLCVTLRCLWSSWKQRENQMIFFGLIFCVIAVDQFKIRLKCRSWQTQSLIRHVVVVCRTHARVKSRQLKRRRFFFFTVYKDWHRWRISAAFQKNVLIVWCSNPSQFKLNEKEKVIFLARAFQTYKMPTTFFYHFEALKKLCSDLTIGD